MPAEPTDSPPIWSVVIAAAFVPAVGFALGMIRSTSPKDLDNLWEVSALLAAVAGLFYWHTYRGTGFVPYALTLSAGAGIWAAVAGKWCSGTIAVAAAGLGLVLMVTGLLLVLQNRQGGLVVAVLLVLVSWTSGRPHNVPQGVPLTDFAILAGVLCAFSWYWFFRPWFELTCEPVLWWMYKIRAAGPGLNELPPTGPCLVIANHASWLDPLFLAKVLPRRTTPMMTAKFYDKRVIGWLVRRFGVIRVPEHALKQDTPELREAIAALDRGECVVIFPEGFLRRSEEKPLKRFGRGVWQILSERPDTPVFNVWIEGAWGSYCSYWNGPPTKNKKRDRRRPIGVGVSAAVTVPADVLANHLRTRVYLMNHVLAARMHLGLPALPAVELPTKDED
jgi:1-acyl-sn-glycerol-3-phosphate acyltransferase